ncbi:hypothetical protein DRJ19_00990 [Candidatus Woesearchaeota archaeon]|nr:MAG: hypothetical protein DRJ19_00990 [Candidatus Woesearchaeota archaeon]
MKKKCIICGRTASYRIKDSSEFYCEECAKEHFNDLSFLQKLAELDMKAKALKDFIESHENELT